MTSDITAPERVCSARGVIRSTHNARIKQIRALRQRKERERTGLFFVDSARLVAEAFAQGAEVEYLVVAPEKQSGPFARELLLTPEASRLERLEVSAEVFDCLASKEGSQGIGAVVRQRWEPLERTQFSDELCWVALEGVQYPGNLGTVLRVCDAVGAAGVLMIGHATDPYDPASVRASLGAVFSQKLVRTGIEELAAWKRRRGYTAIGTSPSAEIGFREQAYPERLLLVMGAERAGMSAKARSLCDAVVRIPMVGRCDSLNLAVATSVVLYEAFAQRGCGSPSR